MEEKVRNLIEKEINDAGLILDEVLFVKENGTNYLRIIIDKNTYVNINDCVKINDLIGPLIEENDLIDESYILDICSKKKGE